MSYKVGVIGGGAWGTALANLLASKGHDVILWAREEEVVSSILNDRENKTFLPNIRLHKNIRATSSLKEALQDNDLLLSVVPSQHVRSVWTEAAPYVREDLPIASASKGIEITSLKLLKDVFEEIFPGMTKRRLAFLSGPTFAREIAQGKIAGATIASRNENVAKKFQEVISTPYFRLYESHDIIGVEVGGAVKNVIAIAAGILDGLNLGLSGRASMITRGLNEMTRFGVALGANPLTFQGLSGMGDLVLTCTGDLSRNRTLGLEIAQGKSKDEILKGRKCVTEGVGTAEALHKIAEKFSLDLPITEQVYQILFEGKPYELAIESLAARGLKEELAGVVR